MLNPNILPNVAGSQTISGEMSGDAVAELQKALAAGYGSDVASLNGGGALRIQSLEKTMLTTIQENQHFVLFNELAKSNATATVDEWTEQNDVGGYLGGSTNTETGNIASATGNYQRRVGLVKYLMTRREVSFVQTLQNTIADSEAVEARNGALQLLTDAEYLCFEGDSTVVPTEYDGIYAQMASLGSVDHIIDAAGGALNSIDLIDKAASTIAGFGNFGRPTHLFCSQLVQSDFNTNLDPAFRVSLTGQSQETQLGAPVKGISTSWGDIKNCPDVFVRDERQQGVFELTYAAVAAANVAFKPTIASATPGAGAADAKFAAGHAGNYYYAVAGINAAGQTAVAVSAQVAIAAGQQVALTINRSGAATETGYVIYRSRLNGTNALTDLREMCRIPASGGATTVFTDKNLEIPGGTTAYVLNMTPGQMAITWRQLLPMTKFPLYPTVSAVVPWAQLLFGYLRIGKRRHHTVIKNIVPTGATWKPFV
ncbi:MAG: hypothetical protein ACJ75S_06775 [Solirubrobacterales bacterium]|jgi:hypothetical protein